MTRGVDILAPTVSATMAVPRDRVRWGPIIAGLFAALCTLVVLSVLGIAVGASTYDPGDPARTFGIGAGIWAGISALIAFFVGGWLAARSAAVRGHGNGTLNGAMVWITAIPVMLFLLGGGLWSATTTAAQSATDLTQGGINIDLGNDAQTASAQVSPDTTAAETQQQSQQQPAVSPRQQERAADVTARSAWGVLVSMVLGLAAAAVGGYVGARREDRYDGGDRDRLGTTEGDRGTATPAG